MNRMSSKFWQLNAISLIFSCKNRSSTLGWRIFTKSHQIISEVWLWRGELQFIVLHCNGPSSNDYLYFHPLHFDSPRPGGFVNDFLHEVADHFSLGENFCQSLPCRKWALGYNWQHQYICIVKAPNILHELSRLP